MEETFTIQRVVDIVRKMRKVTYVGLPNDPDDVRREVTDLKILEDGTLRAYLKGEKYPVRFFTPQETVNIVSVYKRIFSSFLKKGLVGIIIILISQKVWREWFERIFNLV